MTQYARWEGRDACDVVHRAVRQVRHSGAGALHLDKVTTADGALPIMAGKDIVGSIGISGAPGGDRDAVCAQAGLDRIAPGLTAN